VSQLTLYNGPSRVRDPVQVSFRSPDGGCGIQPGVDAKRLPWANGDGDF